MAARNSSATQPRRASRLGVATMSARLGGGPIKGHGHLSAHQRQWRHGGVLGHYGRR